MALILSHNRMQETFETQLLSYRNGYYQGEVKAGRRQGQGLLLLDDGLIVVGNWRADLLFGPALLFVNSEEYAFVEFNRGQLQGRCCFRSPAELLVAGFSSGRPLERQLLANFDQGRAKISTYRNAAYELLQTHEFGREESEASLVKRLLGVDMSIPSLVEYLQKHFCNVDARWELKNLPTGGRLFRFNDKATPLSLGFVLAKDGLLSSYGAYLQDKLHGFGCKYENSSRYEGQFQAGFLNGLGLRLSNNRYSFGQFENGNLVNAIFLEERSAASEDKLRQLKKADHLQSPFFKNGYIKTPLLSFKGISEINAMSAVVKEYLYTQQAPENNNNNLRGSNVSLNQLLSAKPAQSTTGGKQRSPQDNYQSYKGRDSQASSGRKYQY